MDGEIVRFKKDEIICRQGQEDNDLYYIKSGELLVFGHEGTKVTPFAHLEEGEFLGEISFFDHSKRSANVVALKDSELLKINSDHMEDLIPPWIITYANSLTKRIRHLNQLVQKKGIRKQNVKTVAPLSIEEQRHYHQLLEN